MSPRAIGAAALAALAACSVPEQDFAHTVDSSEVPVDAPPDASPSMLTWSLTGDVGLGDVIVGNRTMDQTITVANNGGSQSPIVMVAFDDTSTGFTIDNDACSGVPLEPRHTCTFAIHFAPTAPGMASTMLHARSGSDDLARGVSANAITQGQLDLAVSSYDFKSLAIDAPPVTATFTVTNLGQAMSGIPTPSVSGDTSYTVTATDCSAPLAQADTCTITVQFDPATVGAKAGSLTVTASPGGTDVVTLGGTATAHVKITPAGNGSGHTDSTTPGLNCGTVCDADFSSSPITLEAQPAMGSTFAGWSVDCSGTGSCTLDLTGPKSVIATFTLQRFALAVGLAGNGSANGDVKASAGSIDCTSSGGCSDNYDYGTSVTLTASSPTGTTFAGWSGDCAGTGACSVTMSAAHNVVATFTLDKELLTVNPSGTGSGTVTASSGAINCGTTCSDQYDYGTLVTLTATPATGSTFQSWSGCTTSSGATCMVTMTAAKTVTASFAAGSYTLNVSNTGSGGVTSGDGNINCGSSCSHGYAYNAAVALTAAPATGYHFDHWSGGPCDTSTTATCSFTMPAAATTTAAVFAINTYQLTVATGGTGTGSVASNAGGIACPGTCTGQLNYNTTVTLTATPTSGATTTWSGCDTASGNTCTVTMTAARSVTATFNAGPQTLGVTIASSGGLGSVTSSPAGISCSTGTCSATFTFGSSVTLTAVPQGAATFAGWSGDCTGTGTCTVTMDRTRNVTATFSAGDQVVTLTHDGSGSGSFSFSVTPVAISGNNYTFHYNTSVQITAQPNSTSTFSQWTGDCATQGSTCTLTMDRPHSANATFAPITKRLQITLSSPNSGTGNVTPSPTGTPCSGIARCWDYAYGTPVTLSAVADAGSSFAGWSTCTGTSTCAVTMTADTTETATFVTNYRLSITTSGDGSGTVTGSPSGINGTVDCVSGSSTGCGVDYAGVTPATTVSLMATAASGSTFIGWSGACSGTTPTCSVGMTAAQSVTANFVKQYTLTTAVTGSGSISPSCGAGCAYNSGTAVTLTATPASGYFFSSWSGDCAGQTGQNCSLTMSSDHSATANFAQYAALNVTTIGNGTVTSSDGNISCGTACSYSYKPSPSVTLTATPGANAIFAGWGGACSGTGPCTVTMGSAQNVTATFYNDLQLGTAGNGTVSSSTGGLPCPVATGYSACVAYPALTGGSPTTVTITATPTAGNSFSSWSGDCAGQTGTTCSLTMGAAHATIANFAQITHRLTVASSPLAGGTVTPSLLGTSCGTGCWDYAYGKAITLTQSASSGYSFSGWSGTATCTGTSCMVTMTTDVSETASFGTDYVLSVTPAGDGAGTVTSSPAGVDSMTINCGTGGTTCSESYVSGTTVTLSASAPSGSVFDSWSGACSGTTSPCTVTMTAAKSVTATFKRIYDLTATPTGTGSITPNVGGIASCGTNCTQYKSGTAVTLTANAGSGYVFSGWTGDCTGTSTCMLTMSADHVVGATFSPATYTVTVTNPGTAGTITSNDAALNCGNGNTSCSHTYLYNTTITLSAAAASNWTFAQWTSGCSSSPCTITITGNTTVSAQFDPNLIVTRAGNGTGTVTSSPAGISCGATCSARFGFGSSVTLTASPSAGSHFTSWSGCTSTSGATCTVTMSAVTTATATFTLDTHVLTVTSPSNGSVSGTGISCPGTCSGSYNYGSTVTLTATPSANYVFAGWGGACSGTGTCMVTMNADATVSASFTPAPFSVTASATAGGSATVNGANCAGGCTYHYGDTITLSASPSGGYGFTGWSGTCNGQTCAAVCGGASSCTFTVAGTTNATANFAFVYTLTVSSVHPVTGPGIDCPGTCTATETGTVSINAGSLSCTSGSGTGQIDPKGCTCTGGTCSWNGTDTCTFTPSSSGNATVTIQWTGCTL